MERDDLSGCDLPGLLERLTGIRRWELDRMPVVGPHHTMHHYRATREGERGEPDDRYRGQVEVMGSSVCVYAFLSDGDGFAIYGGGVPDSWGAQICLEEDAGTEWAAFLRPAMERAAAAMEAESPAGPFPGMA